MRSLISTIVLKITEIGENLSLKGTPESSMSGQPETAALSTDGNIQSCPTMPRRNRPWWRIKLAARYVVHEILTITSADCCRKLLTCYHVNTISKSIYLTAAVAG